MQKKEPATETPHPSQLRKVDCAGRALDTDRATEREGTERSVGGQEACCFHGCYFRDYCDFSSLLIFFYLVYLLSCIKAALQQATVLTEEFRVKTPLMLPSS